MEKNKNLLILICIVFVYVVSIFTITIMHEVRLEREKDILTKEYEQKLEVELEKARVKTSGEFANKVATYESFEDGRVKVTTIHPYMRVINDFTILISSHSNKAVIEALQKFEE